MEMQEILNKVAKLRSLSKSSNVNEAAAAAKAAAEIIDKYRLSEIEIELTENKPAEEIIIDNDPLYASLKLTNWKVDLAQHLATHYGCKIFRSLGSLRYQLDNKIKIVGRQSDITIVRYNFAWLVSVIMSLCEINGKGQGKGWRTSFCIGAVVGIHNQLAAARNTMKTECASTAMVKLDNRAQEADDFLRKSVKLKKGPARNNSINYNGFLEGRTAGANIHLGQNLQNLPGSKNPKQLGE